MAISIYASAVEGVTVTSLTDTSVNVSWNAVIIPHFPIDTVTANDVSVEGEWSDPVYASSSGNSSFF